MQMQVFPELQLEKLRLVVKMFLVPQLEKLRSRLKMFSKPQLEKLKKVRDQETQTIIFANSRIFETTSDSEFSEKGNIVNFMPPFAGKNHMQ